jgi:hypothetical protein
MNVITKMMMKKGELTGVSSGFKDLDASDVGLPAPGNDHSRGAPLNGENVPRAQFRGGSRTA